LPRTTIVESVALISLGSIFETENSGPAISEEMSLNIFEDFASDGGTGLGLGLVRRRVRDLGGAIELINTADRIVFSVTVPKPVEGDISPSPAPARSWWRGGSTDSAPVTSSRL
jgi:nitrogen-specific signal transduction histidine kinase